MVYLAGITHWLGRVLGLLFVVHKSIGAKGPVPTYHMARALRGRNVRARNCSQLGRSSCVLGIENRKRPYCSQKGIARCFTFNVACLKGNVMSRQGQSCVTEMYSALQAEVPIDTDSSTCFNEDLLSMLQSQQKVVIVGQALSHCVNFSTRDIVDKWAPLPMSNLVVITDGK